MTPGHARRDRRRKLARKLPREIVLALLNDGRMLPLPLLLLVRDSCAAASFSDSNCPMTNRACASARRSEGSIEAKSTAADVRPGTEDAVADVRIGSEEDEVNAPPSRTM